MCSGRTVRRPRLDGLSLSLCHDPGGSSDQPGDEEACPRSAVAWLRHDLRQPHKQREEAHHTGFAICCYPWKDAEQDSQTARPKATCARSKPELPASAESKEFCGTFSEVAHSIQPPAMIITISPNPS